MSSSVSLRKPNSKSSSNRHKPKSAGGLLGFDLLYQLTYLSAIAAAGIPRNQIFRLASKLPCSTAHYFEEIDRVAQTMNYQYAEACRIVGESVKSQEVKSLLLRLSSSLATGEPQAEFMNREAHVVAEGYSNLYDRQLEALKKWTDAFIALMISVALIIVVATVSTVIYDMGSTFVVGLVVSMLLISGLGSWIIYRTAPRELKTLSGPDGERSQALPRRMLLLLVPAAVIVGAVLFLIGMSLGWVMVWGGVLLVPIGVTAWHLDNKVAKYDEDISTFLRALGATATAIGSTPTEALGRLDMRSLGSLAPAAKRLHTVLRAGIKPELCWCRFVAETGSEVISRSVRVFQDGINLGGEAEEVGSRASLLAAKVTFLRARRRLVSATFGWLSLIMHTAIVFLLMFIIEIVSGFAEVVAASSVATQASGQSMPITTMLSFNFGNLEFLRWLMVPVVAVLSMVNAVTPKLVDGSYSHKLFFYLGASMLAAGAGLVLAPKLAASIFNMAPASF